MKTKILFEDNDILVCHKPAMLAVQSKGVGSMDMESELKKYLYEQNKTSRNVDGEKAKEPYLGIVHRLDQPVEGIIVFAKNKKSAAFLSTQFAEDAKGSQKIIQKMYEAEVFGHIRQEKGTLTDYLIKDGKTNTSKVVSSDQIKTVRDCKKSVLDYELIERLEDTDIIRICLHTGRHHQIRVQFANYGYPLAGDMKYGSEESVRYSTEKGIKCVRLRAVEISFIHPSTHEYMRFGL